MTEEVIKLNGEAAPPEAVKPEPSEPETLWQEYLNACTEVGHTRKQIRILDANLRQKEKELELNEKKVDSLAHKHTQAIENSRKKISITPKEKQEASDVAH